MARTTVTFICAPDDAPQNSPEYQKELHRVSGTAWQEDHRVSFGTFTMDSASGGMWLTGELTFLNAIGPAAIMALNAWLASRNGRKLRIKVGNIEAEANSMADLEKLLIRANEMKQADEPTRTDEAK